MSEEKKENRIYEIGYLLTPNIPEEKLGEEVSRMKATLEKREAFVISDEFPKMRVLAYVIEKSAAGKNEKYQNAYFGHIKFETNPEVALLIKADFEADRNLIRFLMIKTVREVPVAKFSFSRRESAPDEKKGDKPAEKLVSRPSMSEAELDKTIAELIVE